MMVIAVTNAVEKRQKIQYVRKTNACTYSKYHEKSKPRDATSVPTKMKSVTKSAASRA